MHGAIARTEFEGADVAWSRFRHRSRHGNYEIAEHVGAVGAQHVRRQRHDEIGFTQLPSCAESRRRRQIRDVALELAGAGPAPERCDLPVAESPLADKLAVARLRL